MELQRIRIWDEMGLGEGPGFGLYCWLDEWHALVPRAAGTSGQPSGFDIVARDRAVLLRLTLEDQADRFALRLLMSAYQVGEQGLVPFRRPGDRASRLAKHLRDLVEWQAAGDQPLDVGDLAEVSGWLMLTPVRLQARGRVQRAAPELIPARHSSPA